MTRFSTIGLIASVLLFFLAIGSGAVPAEQINGRLKEFQLWCPTGDDGIELQVKVTEKSASDNSDVLHLIQQGKTIYTFGPNNLYCNSLTVLDDGNLGTFWSEGMGDVHHLFVFAFVKSKVTQVLHTSSNGLSQEFVYLRQGNVLTDKKKNQPFQQEIINPNTDWVLTKEDGGSELRPVTADIYSWDRQSKRYRAVKNVTWSRRLQLQP